MRWKRDGGEGPPVLPTIAWRMCILAGTQVLRYNWTFGAHRLQWHDIDLPGSAAGGLFFSGAGLRGVDPVGCCPF